MRMYDKNFQLSICFKEDEDEKKSICIIIRKTENDEMKNVNKNISLYDADFHYFITFQHKFLKFSEDLRNENLTTDEM